MTRVSLESFRLHGMLLLLRTARFMIKSEIRNIRHRVEPDSGH